VHGSHTAYRYSDVLDAWKAASNGGTHAITPEVFLDKIVIVGSIAAGLMQDMTVTAESPRTPGMQIHAQAIDSMLNAKHIFLTPPWVEVALICLLGFIPISRRFERSLALILFTLCVAGLFYVVVYGALFAQRIMLPMALPLLTLSLTSIALGSLYWYHEQRHRRWLEMLEKAKQKFTDMLVHDLKNSIVPLNMAVQMSRTPSISQSFILEELPMYADRATSQLLLQVNSILDIRKMQEGQMPVEPTLLNPMEILDNIVENYRLTAAHGGLDISLNKPDQAPANMLLDPDLFKRISENLIWNAIKYANADSEVQITASNDAGNFIMEIGNRSALLPASEIENIFGAYVTGKGSKDSVHNIPSSGLGLAFCKLAIEAHDGSIVLQSPWPGYDDGVCVTVSIPIRSIASGS
jgi:signal transduction histidine kinase